MQYLDYVIYAAVWVAGIVCGGLWARRGIPIVTPPTPTLLAPRSDTWTSGDIAPFRVVTIQDGVVRYEGSRGALARRCIEGLRKSGGEWCAYRDGVVWDWGPR